MALREWRQLQRHHSAVRRTHRLRRLVDGAPPFSAETATHLDRSLTILAVHGVPSVDLPLLLRRATAEARALPPERVIGALHAAWRRIRTSHGPCPTATSHRYWAVAAQCLALCYGEDTVGPP